MGANLLGLQKRSAERKRDEPDGQSAGLFGAIPITSRDYGWAIKDLKMPSLSQSSL